MERCCITGSEAVSWEHCFCYGTRGQISEKWAIVPLRRDLNTSHPPVEVKELCRLISLERATKEDLAKYPKKNWEQEFNYLNNKYDKAKRESIKRKYGL